MQPLNIIVAVDKNGGFGYKGNIPWKNEDFAKEDFQHFKTLTTNSICVMGYRTYEEILSMKTKNNKDINTPLLPDRESFVVTRRYDILPENPAVKFVKNIRDVCENYNKENKEIFILGGEKLFIEALPFTKTIYMTIVNQIYECDRFFPLNYVQQHFAIDTHNCRKTQNLYFLKLERVR